MLGILFSAFSGLSGLGAWLKEAARWLRAHPAILAALVLAILWRVEAHEAHRQATIAEQRGKALQAAQDASKAELARATAERDAAIKKWKDADNATDQRVAAARADDARRLDAYLGRLRGEFARKRDQVPTPAGTDLAGSSNGPGATSVLDALSTDLAICTANTRRLLELHKQATGQ